MVLESHVVVAHAGGGLMVLAVAGGCWMWQVVVGNTEIVAVAGSVVVAFAGGGNSLLRVF